MFPKLDFSHLWKQLIKHFSNFCLNILQENGKRGLLEFQGLKRVICITEKNMKEKEDFLQLFSTSLQIPRSQTLFISLQRFDADWKELVDIEMNN
jgi:hypothetical protein